MASAFRKIRGITDRTLHGALVNHQQGLNTIGQWAQQTQTRLSWWWWWLAGLTGWVGLLTAVVVWR